MSRSPHPPTEPKDRLRELQDVQRAVLNILEDFAAEKSRLEETQRATLNILDDFNAEKALLEAIQRASVNILEDFEAEKGQLLSTQRASLNILEDFNAEKSYLEEIQTGTLNILDDFETEKARLEQMQSAVLNILEDFEVEKGKVESANRELSAANKELEAFTYSVSHDLRAPLRHIDGFARILGEECGAQIPPEGLGYLTRIQTAVHQMGVMVDELLDLSRIGRQEPSFQLTGLDSLLGDTLTTLKPETKGRAIEWRIDPLPFVECDPGLMKQVFTNLLSNALKFTRHRRPAVIEVGTHQENGQAVIFVRDNGVGFSMKYAHKLFGVFQRLHRSEDFEGTGVGLATIQRIIHKHGGRVWVQAELNQGAAFYFTLGGSEAAASAPASPQSEVRNP